MGRGIRPPLDDALFNAVADADLDTIKKLIAAGGDPNTRTVYGKTILNVALCLPDRQVPRLLLALGADPAQKNLHNGQNALHEAIEVGQDDMLEYLLTHHRFDLEARTMKEETALHIAAGRGYVHAVNLLIEAGADPIAKDRDGRTPQRSALLQSSHRLEFGRPDFIECAHILAEYETIFAKKTAEESARKASAESAARNLEKLQIRSGAKFRPRPPQP